MHNKRTHVHCPTMLMWCSLLSFTVITAINAHAVYANLSYNVYKHVGFSKILDRSYEIRACDAFTCFKFKLNCTIPKWMRVTVSE